MENKLENIWIDIGQCLLTDPLHFLFKYSTLKENTIQKKVRIRIIQSPQKLSGNIKITGQVIPSATSNLILPCVLPVIGYLVIRFQPLAKLKASIGKLNDA